RHTSFSRDWSSDVCSSDLTSRSDWILELALPLVDDVRLYLVRDGQLVEQRQTGYLDSWDDRDLAVPNPTFRLRLSPDTVTTVFLDRKSDVYGQYDDVRV